MTTWKTLLTDSEDAALEEFFELSGSRALVPTLPAGTTFAGRPPGSRPG